MAQRGTDSREKILNVAEQLILGKGFSGTSLDEIIQQSHISKGGFFYHFKNKNELAQALFKKYIVDDELFFAGLFAQADDLSEDPLQQMLLFVKLLSDSMSQLPDVHPGCLIATYTYESQQFEEEIRPLAKQSLAVWQSMFLARLERIEAQYPPRLETSMRELADLLCTVIEGGVIVSRITADKMALVQQLLQYRSYLRLLFDPQIKVA